MISNPSFKNLECSSVHMWILREDIFLSSIASQLRAASVPSIISGIP